MGSNESISVVFFWRKVIPNGAFFLRSHSFLTTKQTRDTSTSPRQEATKAFDAPSTNKLQQKSDPNLQRPRSVKQKLPTSQEREEHLTSCCWFATRFWRNTVDRDDPNFVEGNIKRLKTCQSYTEGSTLRYMHAVTR